MRSIVVSAAIAAAVLFAPAGDGVGGVQRGFVLRVGAVTGPDSSSPGNSLDPAVATSRTAWVIEYATCMKLVNLPDRDGSAGERPAREAADRITISQGGRRYTFHIRHGLRFSNGKPLRAADYWHTLQRLLDPTMNSIVWQAHALDDVVGVSARRHGLDKPVSGITYSAKANTLTIALTHPAPDLLARLAMPPACPVPYDFPADAAGVDNPLVPGSGPYQIADYRRGSEVVLTRNTNYVGHRPHAPAEIDITIGGSADHLTDLVDHGQLDYFLEGPRAELLADLSHRYRVNRRRLFVRVRPQTFYLAFNTERRLFRNNARLRRAVEFALDRPAVVRASGSKLVGTPTDHLLPPALLGSAGRHYFPIGAPKPNEARRLAHGHLRGAHAILYVSSLPTGINRGVAVERALGKIGLQVEVRPWGPQALLGVLTRPKEPYDMVIYSVEEGWPDAASFLGPTLRSVSIPQGVLDPLRVNYARFRNRNFDSRFGRASSMSGSARRAAFARLETRVLSHDAPVAPLYYPNDIVFVSNRVGCVTYNPTFTIDLGAFCLR